MSNLSSCALGHAELRRRTAAGRVRRPEITVHGEAARLGQRTSQARYGTNFEVKGVLTRRVRLPTGL